MGKIDYFASGFVGLRSSHYEAEYFPRATTRSIAYTSTGGIFCATQGRASSDTDNTSVFISYSSNNGATWDRGDTAPIPPAVDLTSWVGQKVLANIAVDSSDELHIVVASGDAAYYANLGVGSTFEQITVPGSWPVDIIDIDVTDDGVPIIIFGRGGKFWIRAKGLLGSWGTVVEVGSYAADSARMASISRNIAGSTVFNEKIAFGFSTGALGRGGVSFHTIDLDTQTGSFTNQTLVSNFTTANGPQGYNEGLIFPTSANQWNYVGQAPGEPVGRPAVSIKFDTTHILDTINTNGVLRNPATNTNARYYLDFAKTIVITGPTSSYNISNTGNPFLLTKRAPVTNRGLAGVDLVAAAFTTGRPFTRMAVTADSSGAQGYRWLGGGASRNLPVNPIWIGGAVASTPANDVVPIASRIKLSTADIVGATGSPGQDSLLTTSEPSLVGSASLNQPKAYVNDGNSNGSPISSGFFQIADDALFTVNSETFHTNSLPNFSAVVPLNKARPSGTQYMRIGVRDDLTGELAFTSISVDFTINHPPLAINPSPQNTYVEWKPYTTLSWQFTDPWSNDKQTAAQVIVEDNATGALVYDTGKVTTIIPSMAVPIPETETDKLLRFSVTVWDQFDVSGSQSTFGVFTLSEPPTVSILTPADSEVLNGLNPTFTWDYNSAGGIAQQAIKVDIQHEGLVIFSSGWIPNTIDTYVLSQYILSNLQNYEVTLSVRDANGLTGSDTIELSTSWTLPDSIAGGVDATDDYVEISWGNPGLDEDFYSWRVYRRAWGTQEEWVLVDEVFDKTTNYNIQDWLAPVGIIEEYSIVQVVNRFGSLVESSYIGQTGLLQSSDYWLINPDDATLNVKLHHVTAENFVDEYEFSSFAIIDRGKHTDIGTRLGYVGSLSASITDIEGGETARSQRLKLELLKSVKETVYLRNPFGDVFKVTVGNITLDRVAGVGLEEMATLTIPYEEIA